MNNIKTLMGKLKKLLTSFGVTTALALSNTAVVMASADSEPEGGSTASLKKVTNPIIGLVKNVLNVLIPLVAAVGAIYCVSIGVKYARAEEPQEREKAKQHLKSAIIGYVLIFVLIVALRIATPELVKWMNKNS